MGGGGWERRRKSSVEIHSGRKQTRNRLSRGERGRTGFLKTPVELSHTRPRPDALFKCVQLENALVLWRIRLPVGLEGDFTAFAGLGYSHSFCLFSPLPRAISSAPGERGSARFAVAASRGRETSFFFQRNSARCTRFDSAAWSYSFILSALLRRITKRNVRFFGGTTPAARHPLSVVRGIFASVKLLPESISLFVSSRACRV